MLIMPQRWRLRLAGLFHHFVGERSAPNRCWETRMNNDAISPVLPHRVPMALPRAGLVFSLLSAALTLNPEDPNVCSHWER